MKLLSFYLVLLLSLQALGASNPSSDKEDSLLAQKVVGALTESDFIELEKTPSEAGDKELRHRMLDLVKDPTPPENETSDRRLLKVEKKPLSGEITFVYEVDFPNHLQHLVFFTVKRGSDGEPDYGITATPKTANRTLFHWGFLLLAALIPLFMLNVAFFCFKTGKRRRILWILFILMGFVEVDMNWATGALSVLPLHVIFLGFQVRHVPPDFWMVSISIPVGACLFCIQWLKKRATR